MIYGFVLSDIRALLARGAQIHVALSLLFTCKHTYLETYMLPIQLNAHHRAAGMAFWQFALVSRLNISLTQDQLEGSFRYGSFQDWVSEWRPAERTRGAVVVPDFETRTPDPMATMRSYGFLTLTSENVNFFYTDVHTDHGSEVIYATYCFMHPHRPPIGWRRALAAKTNSITHLSIEIPNDGWDGEKTGADSESLQLALDPAFSWTTGRHLRGELMRRAAASRRKGTFRAFKDHSQWPELQHPWGKEVARFPSLKSLELRLEADLGCTDPKGQINVVANCAKTWKFALNSRRVELIWDGTIEDASYYRDDVIYPPQQNRPPRFRGRGFVETRIIRYKRK
ncbi:hypothetical protein M011DRAFT_464113 [Sporormia fimetaria CBS 119925]|uniref:Uncharacterized protein n=1 Tax=Sporormia fimetaria CBS 119925 TaxID=1340428 RepID=A0A6A6VNQ2_9PLEO|nr:hypothetical protein M011DRAFT_464113 [Sporormia fimetaria CBS 119925]